MTNQCYRCSLCVRILVAFLSCGGAICTQSAFGFNVQYVHLICATPNLCVLNPGPNDANHEDITREALSSSGATPLTVTLSTGKQLGFDAMVVEYVVNMDAMTDSLSWDEPYVHFDDETFVAGNTRLQQLRSQIGQDSLAGNYLAAQALLGHAIHSVQDFYAHSTWIEQNPGRTDLAALGRPGTLATPSVGPTCTPNATQMLDGVSTGILLGSGVPQLSTEYFSATQELKYTVVYWSNAFVQPGAGKCVHGRSDMNNNQTFGPGINKDSKLRDFFPEAYALAVNATQQFLTDIVADLKSSPGGTAGDTAICGLLGQSAKCSSLEILVQTGQGSFPPNQQPFTAFDSKVSVNTTGSVGFTGTAADGTNSGYVVTAPNVLTQSTFTGGATRVFGGASLNDATPPTVAFQERVSGAPPTFFVRSWATNGSSETIVGKSTAIAGFCSGGVDAGNVCQSFADCPITDAGIFVGFASCTIPTNSNIPFDSASFFQSMNDNGVVTFPAFVNGSTQFALLAGNNQSTLNYVVQAFSPTATVLLRPQISNVGPTACGALGLSACDALVVFLDDQRNIAAGFVKLGSSSAPPDLIVAPASQYGGASQRPGVTSDGQFVVFEANGPTAAGAHTPGVFVSQLSLTGPVVIRTVAIPGLDTTGDPTTTAGQFLTFRPDTRYGVAATKNVDGTYSLTMVFDATRTYTDTDGVLHNNVEGAFQQTALYDPAGNLPNPIAGGPRLFINVSTGPAKIVEIGDAIPVGAAQHVSAIDLWEPLSRKDGREVAFWVAFQEGGQAIVRTP
jgi:hypothetical protein